MIALGVAIWAGWRSGVLSTTLSLVGLFAGYIAAFVLYRPVGDMLVANTSAQPMIAYPIAGLAIIVIVAIGISMMRTFVRKRRRRKIIKGWTPPLWDRAGGAAISATWVLFLVLLVGWILVWLHSVNPKSPNVDKSVVGKTSQLVVGGLAFWVTSKTTGDDTLARTAAAMARDPKSGSESLGGLLNDPRMQQLLNDPELRQQLIDGDPEARKRINEISADPRMLDMAHKAGLLKSDPDHVSPQQANEELADSIGDLSQTINELTADPKIRELLQDPKLMKKIESGDFGQLAQDPGFNDLTDLVWKQIKLQHPDAVRH